MKNLIGSALFALVLCSSSFASDVRHRPAAILSPELARIALREINTTCGDTWCEGAFEYKFNKLTCSHAIAGCTLSFVMRSIEKRSYKVSCHVPALRSTDILDLSGAPRFYSLQWDFYENLTDCIEKLENQLEKSEKARN